MLELFYIMCMLSVPFLIGIYVGVEIVTRRPPTLEARMGAKVASMVTDVIRTARLCGQPVHVRRWIDTDVSHVGPIRLTVERLPQ